MCVKITYFEIVFKIFLINGAGENHPEDSACLMLTDGAGNLVYFLLRAWPSK